MTFETLKQFSIDILWEENSTMHNWISHVQNKRNSIHSFNYRDIGSPKEFLSDLSIYLKFIEDIETRLPPLEDIIDMYISSY